ncbi:MAG: cytotoxic translational repressor of toxin-antitoxin stability system [Deltaproteobacteria bacterium]|nr:cytotoxic translational repressor of toxin-antitoxin stability system [Deltaproteobacteria bacterium]
MTRTWIVKLSHKAEKQKETLPEKVYNRFITLIREIERDGPKRFNWHNYSSLGGGQYHCHLKKGHPTYVAVWEIVKDQVKIVEVKYVGTHGKAPY